MNILSVTSVSNSTVYLTSNDNDVSQLEEEEESLKNQIQQVNSSKENDNTKQAKIKELEAKIQEIASEISQKKSRGISRVPNNNEKSSNSISNKLETDNASAQSNGNVIDTLA